MVHVSTPSRSVLWSMCPLPAGQYYGPCVHSQPVSIMVHVSTPSLSVLWSMCPLWACQYYGPCVHSQPVSIMVHVSTPSRSVLWSMCPLPAGQYYGPCVHSQPVSTMVHVSTLSLSVLWSMCPLPACQYYGPFVHSQPVSTVVYASTPSLSYVLWGLLLSDISVSTYSGVGFVMCGNLVTSSKFIHILFFSTERAWEYSWRSSTTQVLYQSFCCSTDAFSFIICCVQVTPVQHRWLIICSCKGIHIVSVSWHQRLAPSPVSICYDILQHALVQYLHAVILQYALVQSTISACYGIAACISAVYNICMLWYCSRHPLGVLRTCHR